MKKKVKILLWGLTIVPLAAILDTALFCKRDFVSYLYICLWEYLIMAGGMVINEFWLTDSRAESEDSK